MELPFDILDHIFSFLKFHPKALLKCSKAHPVISQIVERYRFRHVTVHIAATAATDFTHIEPSDLRRQLVETPWIVKYVTILTIDLDYYPHRRRIQLYLEEIASLLPMFPVLECIIMFPTQRPWFTFSYIDLPQAFKTAVENCFNLPCLQEVHVGSIYFPLSILDNHANINYLSLLGPSLDEVDYLKTTYPQIKTLALEGFYGGYNNPFLAWAKQHIVGLQSLKYDLSCYKMISEVLKICSDTLEDLYLCFCRPEQAGLINLSSLQVPHLQHLTLHTTFWFDKLYSLHGSLLPKAVEILKAAPTLQKLTIEIYVDPSMVYHVDLSPLRILTDSLRFPHVDLYMYTGLPSLCVTHTMMHSWLAEHEGLVELIERGMLVVHPEETAPPLSRSYIATEHTGSNIFSTC